MKYDYLIVGAGFFGATLAHQLAQKYKVLVIDKREHIGGNSYTEKHKNIDIHKYGAHIFHTNSTKVWNFITQFSNFNNYRHKVVVSYCDKLLSFPINLMTMNQLFRIKTIKGMKSYFPQDKKTSSNFEEEMINRVGEELYDIFIREYTEKQWKTDPKKLPVELSFRIPLRFSLDDHYFNDKYEGIPENGYTSIFEKLLSNCDVELNTEYDNSIVADKVVYTGKIDQFYGYSLGKLEYLSLDFKHKVIDDVETFQGVSVMNYPQSFHPYTRIIEHKYFNPVKCSDTVITEEYPLGVSTELEPYYPVNTKRNNELYQKYKELGGNVIFGGRLGEYKYLDMDKTILSALELSEKLMG